MADIRLAKPAAGASQTITCEPEARFVFDFPTTDATLARDGDNLNIRFEDGSQLQLQGFYQEYNADNLPSFNIDGTEVAAADFFQAMNEPDLMPAAGPGTGTVANGARFHEWGDSALTGGIQHLDGLDWGFSRSFEWDDVPNAVGRNGDDWGPLYSRGEGGEPGAPGGPVPGNTVPELNTPPAPEPPLDPNNPGDDPEKPVGPGNPGGYVPSANGASIVVDEGALAAGSGQHVLHGASGTGAFVADVHAERGGSIVLTHGGQSLTLAIPENDATAIGVPQGGAATFTNVNGVDITILGATSNGDGKWTVSYEYTLAGRVEHDKAAHDTVLFDDRGIAITVTDGSGDVTSGRLTVEVHDDVPQFSVESTGTATSLTGSFGLNFGADAAATTGALTAAGATSTTVEGATTHLTFAEGTLSITNEGGNEFSYTFTPSAAYDNLEFSKDITLTATDGDQDTDTLVITVGQEKRPTLKEPDPDPDPTPTPDPNPDPDPEHPYENLLSVGKMTADEGALPDGTRDHAEHDFKGKGSFTVDMHGENGTITVSDTAHTATVTLDGDRAVVTGDKLFVNGVEVEITGARLEGSEWTVTYRYTLTENVGHELPEKSGDEDTTYGKLMVTATDDDGKSANAVLNVMVHDDAPQFVGEATGSKTSTEGSFKLAFGADGKATEVDSLTAAGATVSTPEAGKTVMEFADGTLTITENDDKTYSYKFVANGTAGDDFEKHIELTATDSDGDTDTFTIVVGNYKQPSFPGTDPLKVQVGEITTDEGALASGTGEHDEHGVKGAQSFRVDMAGKDGTITVSDHEGHTTTITITGDRAVVTGDKLLHVNGVDVEVTDAIRLSGNEWTVNYKYTLTGTVEHELAGASGEDDPASGTLDVTAAFAGEGTTAEAVLTVTVHDDAPHFEGKATGDEASTEGSFKLAFGADGKATKVDSLTAAGAEKPTVEGDTTTMQFTDGTLTITENADKTYSYKFVPKGDTKDFTKTIELTATDSDGDTDTFTIVVGNVHKPSFPGTDPLNVQVGEITTDEGALASGTGAHADHDITGPGSFTVDMHGEDGTVTVSDGKHTTTITIEDGVAKVVSEGTLHVNGVDVVIGEVEPEGTQWTVNYTYTLTESVEHAEGAGKSGADDPVSDTLAVTATYAGEDAKPAHAVIKVTVHDDAPQFDEEEVGDKTSLEGEFGLNFGADAAAASYPLWAEGSSPTRVDGAKTIMEFTEGTLTITSEGGNKYSYTFEPNELYAGKEFSRDIELTAKDGDKDIDTLTIHVGTVRQPNFPGHTPSHGELKVGEITVDEGLLDTTDANGNVIKGTGAHTEHGISDTGSFTVDMHGEDGEITISDQAGRTVTIKIEGGEASGEGTLHVNGVDVVIEGAELVDGKWQVNYTYTLTERVEHAEGAGKSGADDALTKQLKVTATDDDGKSTDAYIKVTVHDDAPKFDVVTPDAEDTLKGEFGLKFGADDMAENYPLQGGAEETSRTLSDDDQITMEFPEGTLTLTRGDGDTWSYEFAPNDAYKNLEFSKDITLIATDKDGDTDTITITVGQEFPPEFITVIPGTDPNEPDVKGVKVIVDEALLDNGTGNAEVDGSGGRGDGHAVEVKDNVFSVNLHGEKGDIVIEAGNEKVTFSIPETKEGAGQFATPEEGSNTQLHVNGVTITFTKAELVDGKWEVHYNYKLDGNITHDRENITGAADAKVNDTIKITVTDDDNKTDTAQMRVEVHDDGPKFSEEAIGDKAHLVGKFELNFGADGKATEVDALTAKDEDGTELTLTTKNGKTVMEFTEGTLTITHGEGNNYSYEFTPNDTHKNLEFSRKITLTATDGDKDTDTTTITVGQEKEPTFPGTTPDKLTVGDITVDEGLLDTTDDKGNAIKGSGAHTEHGTGSTGSFTVDMHGEDGKITVSNQAGNTVTIKIEAGEAKVVSEGTLHINGVDVEITGATLNGTEWTVNYTYTLTKNVGHTNAEESGAADPLTKQLKVTATDDEGNSKDAYINVNVHDDAPVVEVKMDEELDHRLDPLFNKMDFTEANFTSKYDAGAALGYKDRGDGNWTATGGGTPKAGYDNWVTMNTGDAKGVQMTASFVHYQYSVDADGHLTATNVVDLNNGIHNSGKALKFTTANGLSVGGVNSDHTDEAWNGNTAGGIHIGPDKTLTMAAYSDLDKRPLLSGQYGTDATGNDYKTVCGTNVSEAVVFDLGKVAYGMNINLGMLDSADRVLLTFMMTPQNSNDDVIVKTVVVTEANAGTDISVPEGFSKVIVSALPQGNYTTDDLREDGLWVNTSHEGNYDGFTIKDVTFLQPVYTASGTVEAVSADGISSYEWDTTVFDDNGNKADVRIRGLQSGDYKVEMTKTGAGEWTATLQQADGGPAKLAGQTLFTATLKQDEDGVWHWKVEQSLEFVTLNENVDPFQIVAQDGDGDRVPQSVPVDIKFNRFHELLNGKVNKSSADPDNWDDILIGSGDANSLMYGKGGDDVLIADGLKKDTLDGLDTDVQNIVSKLQDLMTAVGGSESRNDALIDDFKKLSSPDQRNDLGKALEKLENTDSGHFGNDALYGGMGNDFLIAGAGNDVIDGAGIRNDEADADIVFAGSGNDIIFYKPTAEYIHGGSGTDILIGANVKPGDVADPMKVSNVEVLLSTSQASTKPLQITDHDSLLVYGIILAEHSVRYDARLWVVEGDTLVGIEGKKTAGLTLYNIADKDSDFEGFQSAPATEFPNGEETEAVAAMSLDEYALDDVSEPLFGTDDTPAAPEAAAAPDDAPVLFAAAPSAGSAAAAGKNLIEGDEDEPNLLFGTDGDDVIIGGSAGDFIDGGAGSDTIYAGGGDDLIVYDPTDYLIDGGTGIDFLLAGSSDPAHSLADMLGNWEQNGADKDMPMVRDVEVMIKGVDTTSLQNMEALAAKCGFSLDKDANGRDVLILGEGWKEVEGSANGTTTTYENGAGITLETTLQATGETDPGDQAAQAIVLSSNG